MPVILRELSSDVIQSNISNHTLPFADCNHPFMDCSMVIVVEHGDCRGVCSSKLCFVALVLCFYGLHAVDDLLGGEVLCNPAGILRISGARSQPSGK
jgi:hypothetical protein